MKKFSRYAAVAIIIGLLAFGPSGGASAATTVNLGTADGFAVLAGQHVTDVPASVITGDVGLSPAAGSFYAGLTSAEVTGTIYAVDGTGPAGAVNNPALLTGAKNDLTAAYLDAAGRTPTQTFVAGDNQLGGQTLTAGVYAFGHATTANVTAASPLTLDGQNDPNAVFIFQASSDLILASSSVVRLTNQAQACNVFWQVTSSTTLGTGSTFVGTVMALTSITDNGSSTVSGRLLARNADTVLNKTTITKPTCGTTPAAAVTPATPAASSPAATSASSPSPSLPNTGGGASAMSGVAWAVAILVIALVALVTVYFVHKKRPTTPAAGANSDVDKPGS